MVGDFHRGTTRIHLLFTRQISAGQWSNLMPDIGGSRSGLLWSADPFGGLLKGDFHPALQAGLSLPPDRFAANCQDYSSLSTR
jgi:hypothetical protein